MRIELATVEDVHVLQELQRKAFGPQCIELGWEDAQPMTETLEHAYEDFEQCTTLKVLNEDRHIIGSIRGHVTDGSLYIGRLMVLPEYRQQGIGKQLFREIQLLLPHNRAWLCTCKQVPAPYEFYLREGFRPYKDETVGPGLTWVYMQKNICLLPKDKWEDALKLVKEVFMEFEAPDYCDEGIADFMHAINDKSYLNMHRFYGAYQDDKLVGVIATRNNHHHIGLLFVDKNYQHMGIGSQLIQNIMVLKDDGPITVNVSPYGHEFYKKLGFVDTSEEQITNGVRYYPMERK